MSEILSRTVFETCLADQTEAPWAEEVRMLLAHDAALRAALAAAEREAAYNADEVTRQNHLWSERCETAEAERDALRSRLAEMDHLGTGAGRSAMPEPGSAYNLPRHAEARRNVAEGRKP